MVGGMVLVLAVATILFFRLRRSHSLRKESQIKSTLTGAFTSLARAVMAIPDLSPHHLCWLLVSRCSRHQVLFLQTSNLHIRCPLDSPSSCSGDASLRRRNCSSRGAAVRELRDEVASLRALLAG
ncbi:hypothetical protein C8Q74DRAFT_421282 [Fomes fomentarius]|nr:hypothetical protein C8Q74DRAFT_421282 [Fomes fomentarius]